MTWLRDFVETYPVVTFVILFDLALCWALFIDLAWPDK